MTGARGDKGDTGAEGRPGASGPRGSKGDKGDKGDPGEAGPQGERGKSGSVGSDGWPGPPGPQGSTGQAGPAGPQGPAGAASYATPAIVLGTAAAQGAASSTIRSDATVLAFDATAPVTQAFGDAAATGSAAVAARRDHKHGIPTESVTSVAGKTGSVTLAEADVANLSSDLALKAPLASPTFTGTVTVPTPVNGTDSTTKTYVDGVANGLAIKASARVATNGALPTNTYLLGVITETGFGALTVDGVTVAVNDRVLVKDEAAGANNGLYLVTTAGDGTHSFVLTRTTDMNQASEVPGAFAFVEAGTVNAGNGYVVASAGPFTIGTTIITWTQFSGAGEITAGAGLSKSGNTISNAQVFTSTAPTASAVGDAAASGSAADAAKRDHIHGREAFATPAIVLGSAVAAGSATTHIRSDGTIAAFDTTAPATQAFSDAAAVGTVAFAARRDHKHAMMADPTATLAGYWQINETDLAGSAANFDLTSIPATYQRLFAVFQLRSDNNATNDNVSVSLNNDTTDANYDRLLAQAASASWTVTQTLAVAGSRRVAGVPAATALANSFATLELIIDNYASTTAVKVMMIRAVSWQARTTGGLVVTDQMIGWSNTAAVSRITVAPVTGSNWVSGCKASLYGLKAG